MSDLKKQIEFDLKRVLENLEKQNTNDRLKTIRDLLDKYIHLSTCDYMLDHDDLMDIVCSAKNLYATKTFPIHLGQKKKLVKQDEQANLCVIEATIGHLCKNDCLKKLPKFDKRDNKF